MESRYFDPTSALNPGLFRSMILVISGIYIVSVVAIILLNLAKKLSPKKSEELKLRMISWAILIGVIGLPIVLGAVPSMVGMMILSVFCFNEYARAVGLFREKTMVGLCLFGIIAVNFAAIDAWYTFFNALAIQIACLIAGSAILKDQPKGYTERVGLAVFGFIFFGYGLAHVSYLANDTNFRAVILFLFLLTEMNDVFAYITGHLFGKEKLIPNTSPGKTRAGAIGAVILTTISTVFLGKIVFAETRLDNIALLLPLGLILTTMGQLGDLMLSSIKRDIGVKDLGNVIPGHGGFLDRFDSLVLTAPAVFHFLNFYDGINIQNLNRLITGS
ncbi:MAG: phosphatidate cytidylyltransferase [Proteobacteria bacterium]|nr:phosphatidate cytidylyltransferase [Pseudomonadota bacterium]